jgi:hypothetical protein
VDGLTTVARVVGRAAKELVMTPALEAAEEVTTAEELATAEEATTDEATTEEATAEEVATADEATAEEDDPELDPDPPTTKSIHDS